MLFRRCKSIFFEPKQCYSLDLANLTENGNGLAHTTVWYAHTCHLDKKIKVSIQEIESLGEISEIKIYTTTELKEKFSPRIIDLLIEKELLIEQSKPNLNDKLLREIAWHPIASLYHISSRWGYKNLEIPQGLKYYNKYQVPPPLNIKKTDTEDINLTEFESTYFDQILKNRTTCREFDASKKLSFSDFSKMVNRVWGIKSIRKTSSGFEVAKKTSPSGGGIHSIESYFIINNVENLTPGIYHYLPSDNSIEKLKSMSSPEIDLIKSSILCNQSAFLKSQVLVIMTCRFDRLLWKYRNHSKAYKVGYLDAGHLSQTMYLSGSELDLGVFISSAINEKLIEKELDLNLISEGVITVGGFGIKTPEATPDLIN